ncbi:MAG: CAR family subclass B3 metallo-beta-lactamase [Burkholderiaceae bacterium]
MSTSIRKRLAVGMLAIATSLGATSSQAQDKATTEATNELDGCPSDKILARFQEFGRTGKMPPVLGRWLGNPKAQKVEPYQAFDNVYYVGVCWVSAWIIKTSAGPVLIDTLHEPFVDLLIENIRKVGVDPADIKLVLMTHGHFDHVGGALKIKALTKAPFVMSQEGWDEAIADSAASKTGRRPWAFLDGVDTVAKDGQQFTVGDTTFTAYETPGHTMGTASYAFDVRDGDQTYHAFTVGGLGLNAIKSVAQVEAYIASVNRIESMVRSEQSPISVHLTTHPFSTGLTEAARKIPARRTGEPHPLVDKSGFLAQLDNLRAGAEKRLVIEREKGKSSAR